MDTKHPETKELPDDPDGIVQTVKERYGAIAESTSSGCCGPQISCCGPSQSEIAAELGYTPTDLGQVPEGANLGLGCGAPTAWLELRPGERVVDLGSGAGLDAILAAHAVGAEGQVIGIDMTPQMLAAARSNAASAGLTQVEFREGRLEDLPVDDASVDAVTSNCVINLVPDKGAVFREICRVLKPGGRMVISDVVLDGALPEAVSSNVLAYVGCVAGALQRDQYFSLLEDAGLGEVQILKDVDFIELVGDSLPAELQKLADASGITAEDVRGLVRSVTYRAVKSMS
jgi:SAM-dependent methyltransferase